jgi:beta-galactosidase/beta-glucuronidase
MKEMGINCVRIYSVGKDLEKVRKFIRDMYEQFGIYTIVSDWLSLWNHPGPNYSDKEFRKKEEERILKIVEALKNEKGLLMWVLGNENNYTFSGKIGFWTSPQIEEIQEPYQQITKRAEIYYSFIEDLALAIKAIDKVHPVALGNGELDFLDVASKVCKSIDVLAIIVYRGERFGNLFDNIKTIFDRPVFLSEFGCDSYNAYKNQEDQDIQAKYLLTQWQDLYDHTLFSGNQEGNCIGGAIFEWNDEWWKHNEGYSSDWDIHNKEAGWSQGAYYFDIKAKNNLNMNEEWFGVVSLSEEKENGLNKRVPKKSFYVLKEFFSCLSDTSSHKETNP